MDEKFEPPLRTIPEPRHSNGHGQYFSRLLHWSNLDQKLEKRLAVFGSYVGLVSTRRLGVV
jgi:hypothetical protein